jgi:hypothetical protein
MAAHCSARSRLLLLVTKIGDSGRERDTKGNYPQKIELKLKCIIWINKKMLMWIE